MEQIDRQRNRQTDRHVPVLTKKKKRKTKQKIFSEGRIPVGKSHPSTHSIFRFITPSIIFFLLFFSFYLLLSPPIQLGFPSTSQSTLTILFFWCWSHIFRTISILLVVHYKTSLEWLKCGGRKNVEALDPESTNGEIFCPTYYRWWERIVEKLKESIHCLSIKQFIYWIYSSLVRHNRIITN